MASSCFFSFNIFHLTASALRAAVLLSVYTFLVNDEADGNLLATVASVAGGQDELLLRTLGYTGAAGCALDWTGRGQSSRVAIDAIEQGLCFNVYILRAPPFFGRDDLRQVHPIP